MLLNCGVGEDSWESLGLQGDPTSPSWRKSVLNIHWKDWCWSWNSNPLATWCKELTHWKRPWCWERLRAGREGDDRGWDGWMASSTWWTRFWVNSRIWWWKGGLVCCSPWGCRVRHDWATELNWTDWTITIGNTSNSNSPVQNGLSMACKALQILPLPHLSDLKFSQLPSGLHGPATPTFLLFPRTALVPILACPALSMDPRFPAIGVAYFLTAFNCQLSS